MSGQIMVDMETARKCALIAAKAADSKKASDIMVQEVGEVVSSTDFFVISTAVNNRQVAAIIEEIEEQVRVQTDLKPIHREGLNDGTWALLDYGFMIVHVFQPEARDFYRLETLWNDAPIIDLKEAGITDVEYSDRIAKILGEKQD